MLKVVSLVGLFASCALGQVIDYGTPCGPYVCAGGAVVPPFVADRSATDPRIGGQVSLVVRPPWTVPCGTPSATVAVLSVTPSAWIISAAITRTVPCELSTGSEIAIPTGHTFRYAVPFEPALLGRTVFHQLALLFRDVVPDHILLSQGVRVTVTH